MLKKLFIWFQGRSTFFALFFSLTGFYLAAQNKLTMSYIALVSAVQSLVVAHSFKEDREVRLRNDKFEEKE